MGGGKADVHLVALRLLSQRRLTQAQLQQRLERKEYSDEDIRAAVCACERQGYLDDTLFARLFVEGRSKAVGDARLIADLVRRGIDREAAIASVAQAACNEEQRLEAALGKLFGARPTISYPSAARALQRLGFSTPAIYRELRSHAQKHGPLAELSAELSAG